MRRAIDRSIARAYSFRTDFLFSFFFFFKSSITKLANRRNTRSNEFGGKKKVISTFPSAPPFHPRIRYTMDRGHPRERNIVDVEKKKKRRKKNINFNCGESRSSPLKEYLRVSALNRRPATGLRIHFGDYGKM